MNVTSEMEFRKEVEELRQKLQQQKTRQQAAEVAKGDKLATRKKNPNSWADQCDSDLPSDSEDGGEGGFYFDDDSESEEDDIALYVLYVLL